MDPIYIETPYTSSHMGPMYIETLYISSHMGTMYIETPYITNTSVQAESLLPCLELTARDIGIYMISDKTEFMCFKEDGAIFSLNDKPLKLVDYFTYVGCNILSSESDVNICIRKAWTVINNLLTIWKSNLSDKM